MKTLILTADDFGMSPETNRGIMECHTNGIISSASLMANMPGFDEAVRLLKKHETLDAGIHLNLTWEKPLTRAKTLVDENGFFRKDMISRLLMKKVNVGEARQELEAQAALCIKRAKISHINSHKHIHVFPLIMKVCADIAVEHKIRWIRLPYETIKPKISLQLAKLLLLRHYSAKAARCYRETGLRHTDNFIGISHTGNLTLKRFKNLLSNVNEGITEIMCHPGYQSNAVKNDMLAITREKELDIVTNPEIKQVLEKFKIKLSGFRGIE